MKTNSNEIKIKLEKVLRLSESSNANEAAAAVHKLNTLCRQYGIAKIDLSVPYNPSFDEIIEIPYGPNFKRTDIAANLIYKSVAYFYNGSTIIDWDPCNKTKKLKIVASKSNQIQIELYSSYLLETMEKISKTEKKRRPNSPSSYRTNFRKGFALEIQDRLLKLKEKAEKEGIKETNQSALAVYKNNKKEYNNSLAFIKENYPDCKSNREKIYPKYGFHDGTSAAEKVGLFKQANGMANNKLIN
ncbi:DUF2786 domain-containing protein [Prochlorococcus sp. MIT 0916]|uniref:DUF2786 domain-containing protein n=1 Tax=Prochlorococcus sp. MIT 0916 TaxID=3082521 RepID=UPI0039B6778E